MTLDGFGTRFDEQHMRARQSSVPSWPGFAGRIVTDQEAKKVEPHAPVDGVQRVTDPRFARLELQPNVAQPRLSDLLRALDPVPSRMQHHEVVRVDHHLRAVVAWERR